MVSLLAEQVLAEIERGRPKDGELPLWQDAYNSADKVKCSCPWPHVERSGSQALGLVLDIDLCCLARAVEELTGRKFYRVVYTQPAFIWDCCEKVQVGPKVGERPRFAERGAPPSFMLERASEMGIEIVNLERHGAHSRKRA